VRLVIQLHHHHYPDGLAQVKFIIILLSGITLTWFALLFEGQSSLLNNFEAILEEFIATFEDSKIKCTSNNKLQSFRQGS
jgi:hypothetical protein